MEQWLYSLGLIGSLCGLALLDRRFKLAFWHNARRTLIVLCLAIALFVVWDLAGIQLGIFHHANSDYTLPLRIAPEFPIEEILFLAVLHYSALLLYRGALLWKR